MHIQQKEKLINLIDTARKLQEMLPQVTVLDDRITILTKCQEVAISVGETLENIGDGDNGIVHLLEEYCEMIFALAQMEVVLQEDIKGVQDKLSHVRKKLGELSTKYRVVFLPYKADMWDSLESIWIECVNDPRCECDVVPIPYFELNRDEKKWESRYDGARFPSDVPIIHYDYYRMDEMKPDVAYIHNPYDDCNHVTTVHPYYYSDELKKNVRKLVYVPYYANTGFIASDQQVMPVCHNMDYMIVQSENAKETCRNSHFYNKILPLGSPKFDKVINKSQKGVQIPEEWNRVIVGRKVLMLNTTLNDLLMYGELLINKLKYFFEIIKAESRVALIWRPHPLFEATIKSMRPHLLGKYKELVEYFVNNNVGVLDLTGDVSNTVAIADGYVGSSYSSVINLFGVCGKPIFLFDNMFYEDTKPECRKNICFRSLVCFGDRLLGIPENGNIFFELKNRTIKILDKFQNEPGWVTSYWSLAEGGGKLYFSPFWASHAVEYDIMNSNYTKMSDVGRELNINFLNVIIAGNKVFFLPRNDFLMMEYDTVAENWNYHTECMAKLWDGCDFVSGMWRSCGVVSQGKDIWITTGHTNTVLQFNVENAAYKVHCIGEETRGYSELVADEAGLWMVDSQNGDIIRWKYQDNKIKAYHMPDGFECWKNPYGIMKACGGLIDMGKYLITVPGHANCMVRFDKDTGERKLLVPEFWERATENVNGFDTKYVTTGGVCVKLDDTHILVQRKCDCAMAKVDVVNDTFEMFYPTLSEKDFDVLMDGEDGFEKARKLDYFCRRESKIFTIQGFIDDLVEGRLVDVRERQLEELSTLAANLDGTCGQKVHEFMMNVLEEEK